LQAGAFCFCARPAVFHSSWLIHIWSCDPFDFSCFSRCTSRSHLLVFPQPCKQVHSPVLKLFTFTSRREFSDLLPGAPPRNKSKKADLQCAFFLIFFSAFLLFRLTPSTTHPPALPGVPGFFFVFLFHPIAESPFFFFGVRRLRAAPRLIYRP